MSKAERRKLLGLWIKYRREDLKMTQAGLAKALGYDNAQIISNIERGVSAIPQKRVADFSSALQCDNLELNLRVLSSSLKDAETAKAADLALKYFAFLRILDQAPEKDREAILDYSMAKLNVKRDTLIPPNSIQQYQTEV